MGLFYRIRRLLSIEIAVRFLFFIFITRFCGHPLLLVGILHKLSPFCKRNNAFFNDNPFQILICRGVKVSFRGGHERVAFEKAPQNFP
jgi:hypothetical protein